VFFQIPSYLKSEFETSGKIPSRQQMASHFEVGPTSIELLLRVTEMDRRVPTLFERDSDTREITSLNLDNITAFVTARGDQVRVTQWEGQTLPSFELPTLDGKPFSSQELNGKPALIYFWFTGCPPCVRIAPILAEIDKEYRSKGLRIVGMNADTLLGIDTSAEQMKGYLKKNGTEYLNLVVNEKVGNAFGHINVFPTLFLVGKDGKIRKHLLNFQDRETLEGFIREMLN
jgi:cytochrome c-type biogenesis protein